MKPEDSILSEQRIMDTMSETSEGTTTTTLSGPPGFETREELMEIVEALNLNSLEELHRERFRVDRRKLELMLMDEEDSPNCASVFFRTIMDETNTIITWPSRLKIGAKSKKDPHIKVAGRAEDVEAAKQSIMQILDTRQSMRVTMKLDVSYTDHSHIIGKGGLTIKRVMEETCCHIHFPDSNRSNHQEKSNQVSIAGEMAGVEKSRFRLRFLTPVILCFELPLMGSMYSYPDSTSPCIVKIQERYNIQVMFRTRPKLHATLVVVKGCEWEVRQVKEATILLMHHMCKAFADQIQIQMSMEISPQHHSIVLGRHSINLKNIMQRTATQIIFPDAGDPNIPSLKKSNVIITGDINNVYLARQQLIGSLPLVLMFDLPEAARQSVDTDKISHLMQTYDVFINVLNKPKQSSLSVIIKGVERNATNIYEARRHLLCLDASHKVTADIPLTYKEPTTEDGMPTTQSLADRLSLLTQSQCPSPFSMSPMSHRDCMNPARLPARWNTGVMFPSGIHPAFNAGAHLLAARQAMMNQPLNPGLLAMGSHPPGFAPFAKPGTSDRDTSAYLSLSSASSTLSSPAISPRNISPIGGNQEGLQSRDLSGILAEMTLEGREKKGLGQGLGAFDYEQKRLLAMKAMKTKPNPHEFRIPTTAWAGCGMSQTMPAAQEDRDPTDLWENPGTPIAFEEDEDCPTPIAMTSAYVDHTPSSRLEKILSGNHTDLASAMVSGGLDKKWIDMLASHEIDMSTFVSLTERDLTDIGVTAWGARRKMMLLIAELKKRTKPFSGSAAPGAERRSSLTIPSAPNAPGVEGKW